MKRTSFFIYTIVLVCSIIVQVTNGQAQQNDVIGMVTGSLLGTYYAFGEDIARIAEEEGIEIDVKESKGSLDNILRMDSHENAAFGIVQSDVLGFLQHAGSRNLQRTADKLVMIFPLYNEEVHLFARRDIKNIHDLEGKRVVVGADGSGNYITASNLLHIMSVRPREELNLSPADAVEAVLLGEADAMFYVAGKPVKIFTNLEKLQSDPQFAPLIENMHFVPLTDRVLLDEYVSSDLETRDYSWLDESVSTIAVKAILISYDFTGKSTWYYKHRCDQLAVLGKAIWDSLSGLQRTGHDKWTEIELDEESGNWKVDECSHRLIINGNPPKSCPDDRTKTYQDELRCTIKGGEWDGKTCTCTVP